MHREPSRLDSVPTSGVLVVPANIPNVVPKFIISHRCQVTLVANCLQHIPLQERPPCPTMELVPNQDLRGLQMLIHRHTLGTGARLCAALLVFMSNSAAQTTSPALTMLYSFQGPPGDGHDPQGNLAVSSGGVLYGVTSFGGKGTACLENCGIVFSLTPPASPGAAWTETVLHNFTGGSSDGFYPSGSLELGNIPDTCGLGLGRPISRLQIAPRPGALPPSGATP